MRTGPSTSKCRRAIVEIKRNAEADLGFPRQADPEFEAPFQQIPVGLLTHNASVV